MTTSEFHKAKWQPEEKQTLRKAGIWEGPWTHVICRQDNEVSHTCDCVLSICKCKKNKLQIHAKAPTRFFFVPFSQSVNQNGHVP